MFRAGRNKPITKASVKEHVHDYCSKTSIHGIKYVGERDRPRAERLWWTVMLVLAASGSGYNIHKIWRKWTTSPVIVTFAERSTPVWQVPFPAVTICPQVKSRATIFNFTDVYSKLVSGTELPTVNRTLLSDAAKVSLVCTPKVEVKNSTEETVDESVIDFLIKVAPKLEDALNLCKWNNLNIKCEKIFKPLMTEEGICYTFNLLEPFTTYGKKPLPVQYAVSKWSLEDGYGPDSPVEGHPYRTLEAGTSAGLTIELRSRKKDSDSICGGAVPGFKVLLHNPTEVPRVYKRFFRVPLAHEVLVGVKPEIMTTNVALQWYPYQVRQCYFYSEKNLTFFSVYTQQNCYIECIATATISECGCLPLYMPCNSSYPICGPAKKKCISLALEKLKQQEYDYTFKWKSGIICECLPACTSIEYDWTLSQAAYDFQARTDTLEDDGEETNVTEVDLEKAKLTIYFTYDQFITNHRSELFGFSDFLASCGGVLGLFSGISLLSIIEIVYYVTLRFWNNLRRSKDHRESGRKSNDKELN